MAAKQKIYNLGLMAGGMNTVAEEGSLISFMNPLNPMATEFRDIENFRPQRRGGQATTFGFALYRDLGTGIVTGLHEFVKSNGTTEWLATLGTDLIAFTDTTQSTKGNWLEAGLYTDFTTADNKVVICNGVSVAKVYDGTAITNLGGGPPAAAKASVYYQNRLFIFSQQSNPSYVYYSDPLNIEAGYSTGSGQFIPCGLSDGQKITSLAVLFVPGQLEPVLVVGKERSAGIITGDGSSGNPFKYSAINTTVGLPSFRAFVQFGQNIAYLTRDGVGSYQTDVANVNLLFKNISEKVRPSFSDLPPVGLPNALAWHDFRNSRITFAVQETGYTVPNVLWHYDTELECWYKERWSPEQGCSASLITSDGRWLHGDQNGKVYLHSETLASFDDQPIEAQLTTDTIDFGTQMSRKFIRKATMVLKGDQGGTVGFLATLDHGQRTAPVINLKLKESSAKWGEFNWNEDSWAGVSTQRRDFYPSWPFYNMAFTLSQTGLNQPTALSGLEFLVEQARVA